MPINLITSTEHPVCHGFRWEITDELILADLVARLMLGHYRHVNHILAGVTQQGQERDNPVTVGDLISFLGVPANDTLRYHRDGWVFQMISWIAARLAQPGALTAPPHSQAAQKGFDNLIIERDAQGNVIGLVISEDKATENSRSTVTGQVWPELRDFETGRRDRQLVNEVTAILERCRAIVDVDESVNRIFWNGSKKYRIALTTDQPDNQVHRTAIFGDYDNVVPGSVDRRRAETMHKADVRAWMDSFCAKIIDVLEENRCTTV